MRAHWEALHESLAQVAPTWAPLRSPEIGRLSNNSVAPGSGGPGHGYHSPARPGGSRQGTGEGHADQRDREDDLR